MSTPDDSKTSAVGTPRGGAVRALLRRGLIRPGDHLLLERPSGLPDFRATVRADGRIETADGVVVAEPGPGSLAYHGAPRGGWLCYLHAASGRTLGDLLRETPAGPS